MSEIKYLKNKNIDKKKWDKCISASENSIVYAVSWYLDKLCPGWDALISGDYAAVMPIIHNKKYFIHYIYNPYFSARLGVFSKTPLNNPLLFLFFNSIPKKYKLISVKINSYKPFHLSGFIFEKKTNYELKLTQSYKELFSGFSKNHRKNIRRAYKSSVQVKKEPNIKEMILLKKKLMSDVKTSKLNKYHFLQLQNLLLYAQNKSFTKVYNVYDETRNICGSAVFLIFQNRAIIYSATNSVGKKFLAGYILVDSFIRDFAGSDIILDFAGSDIKGIADFNAGFGSTKKTYRNFTKNTLPFPLNRFV
ncbi:MAG: hypothetical protein GXO80_02755 [Chlorobi bacterium]|nr:hypothetical protein [Chlorobiota bacterium]